MSQSDVMRNLWRNSGSNYARTIIRMGTGLVTFRLMYQHLGGESFGFWALLWSLLSYGVLLDFGFGFTSLKKTAEYSATGDWSRLSQLLSSILAFYVVCALLVVGLGFGCSGWLVKVFQVSPENQPEFIVAMRVFFVGMALSLPTCVFPEILKGQHRIHVANNIAIVAALVNMGLVALAPIWNWGLVELVLSSMVCIILPNVIAGGFALRGMPAVRLSWGNASRGALKQASGFSAFAFLGTISTLIKTRADQVVISLFLGVIWVPIYQAGAKLGEMFSLFAAQLSDVLLPAAAHFHARQDPSAIRKLLLQGMRLTVLAGLPIYLLMAAQLGPLLELLTGEEAISHEAWQVGQVALAWFFLIAASQSVFRNIFFMCGKERSMAFLGMGEALLNLGASILLVKLLPTVVAVALGSLVATLVFTIWHWWPMAARELRMSPGQLARQLLLSPLMINLPLIAWFTSPLPAAIAREWWALPAILVNSLTGLALTLPLLWQLGLSTNERGRVLNLCKRFNLQSQAL